MKRIMHILNTGLYSGAENVVITIINAMKSDCECAYVSPEGKIRRILDENGIFYVPIKKMSVREIKSAIKSYKPDVIHAHDFAASITAALTLTKTPIVSHLHNNPPWLRNLNLKTIAYYIGSLRIQKILGVSDAVFDDYIFGRLIRKKTAVVSNSIDLSLVRGKAERGTKSSSYDIIFLGRLSLQKNPLRFIDIIQKVKEQFPDVKACMVGSGELRAECERHIQKLNLSNNLELLGFRENPYIILSNAKMICITSDWEGFGLVAVEALALGIPVLATPVGGLPGIVNSDCGRLCGDDDAFIQEISQLLTEPIYWDEKSKGALNRAEQFNNIQQYMDRLKAVYKDCSY